MQQRKSASSFGRPSGTDGSDFSYRMVVDSRYAKVAKGKYRLHLLIIAQMGLPFFFFTIFSSQPLGVKDTADMPPFFLLLYDILFLPTGTDSSWAIIQWIGGLSTFLLSTSKEGPDKFAISTVAVGFISVLIGEFGQRRSRVNFLRLYMITSSIAFLLSIAFVFRKNSLIEVLQDMSSGEMKLFELLEIGYVVLGFLVQISTISTIISLIWNMSPPKRAS